MKSEIMQLKNRIAVLERGKEDVEDNIMRVNSHDIAAEILELGFGSRIANAES